MTRTLHTDLHRTYSHMQFGCTLVVRRIVSAVLGRDTPFCVRERVICATERKGNSMSDNIDLHEYEIIAG